MLDIHPSFHPSMDPTSGVLRFDATTWILDFVDILTFLYADVDGDRLYGQN